MITFDREALLRMSHAEIRQAMLESAIADGSTTSEPTVITRVRACPDDVAYWDAYLSGLVL